VSGGQFELIAIAAIVAVVASYLLLYVAAALYARGNAFPLLGTLLMLVSAFAALALGWLVFQGLTWVVAG
jgi:hypothetical protein